MRTRRLPERPSRIRLPVVGEVTWPAFYTATLVLPPLFVVAVWLFFSHVDWPHAVATRALFVSAVSVVLAIAFSAFLLNATGRSYGRLRAALKTVRRQNLQLRALHHAGLVLNEELDLSSVLSRIVGLSRHVLGVASARLEPVADGMPTARDEALPDDPADLRVPVRFHGQRLAILHLSRPGLPFAPEEAKTAERFATQAGAAIANARLLDEVRHLGGAAERERIARDLHDGTVQSLYGLSLKMHAALMSPSRTTDDLEAAMRSGLADLAQILREIRAYVSDARHAEHDHCDLETAMRAELDPLVAQLGARVEWRFQPARPVCVPVGTARELAEVVRESVRNAVRHANPTRVTITADVRAGSLLLEVRDDGRGFAADGSRDARGLVDMARRMRRLGGELAVESRPGHGTRVVARLPWAAA